MRKHLPGGDIDSVEDLGTALLLEKLYWENFSTAVANGIGTVL